MAAGQITKGNTMHRFYKYQGTGNDFIIFDNRRQFFDTHNERLIKRLCDRRFGIGADGLMLLQDAKDYDFEMVYFNSDGRKGTLCGNGGRCIVSFAHRMGLFDSETHFLAADGGHAAFLSGDRRVVKLRMGDVSAVSRDGEAYVLDTGSPHYVKIVENLEGFPVVREGQAIRHDAAYREQGINVNFVVPGIAGGSAAIRTFERGVEDETLACGTGATAAAIALSIHANVADGLIRMPLQTRGGALAVHFHKARGRFSDIFLEGPARPVFEGLVDLGGILLDD